MLPTELSLGKYQMFLELPEIKIKFADPNQELVVYKKDPQTLARTQAIPGQGLEHRIGGLEKSEDGGVSYDPENHEKMTHFVQRR